MVKPSNLRMHPSCACVMVPHLGEYGKTIMRIIWTTIATLALLGAMPAAQSAETVGRSNPLRKVLLDSLRPAIQNDLGVDVQFVVETLQVEGHWAFMAGSVQRTDGSPIDFSQTPYAEAEAEGMFDGPTVKAILSQQGNGWMVEAYSIGATDVVEAGWPDEYGVPCDLVAFCD